MSIGEVIQNYAAAWLEQDDQKRRSLLDQVWADDGTYTDPQSHVIGRAALSKLIGDFQQQYPGQRIVLTSGVDRHHSVARFGWQWLDVDGILSTEGTDFAEFASDGRLRRIVGFFGPLPAVD